MSALTVRKVVTCALLVAAACSSLQLVAQQKKTASTTSSNFGSAGYRNVNAGKYMRSWWLAGPFAVSGKTSPGPSAEMQESFFNDSLARLASNPAMTLAPVSMHGKDFSWKQFTSRADVVDVDSIFNKSDYAACFALAEITADSSFKAFFAIGSDDGVKVWHNGKLIHKNWVARGIEPDNDVIPVSLVKGSNKILVEVQDISQGWGFMARFLDRAAMSDRLTVAASSGNLDDVTMYLDAGTDINKKNANGLSPVDAAKLAGREEVVQLLLRRGAVESNLPTADKLVDGLYSQLNGKTSPGIAVLVARDGKIVYQKGFGYADIENKVPVLRKPYSG